MIETSTINRDRFSICIVVERKTNTHQSSQPYYTDCSATMLYVEWDVQ